MSGPRIWLIMGETGEGSSWISWVVGYSTKKKEAVSLANAAQAVISIKYRDWMGGQNELGNDHLDEISNPFDSDMVVAPPGVKYTVVKTKHIGDIVNVQAGDNDSEAAEDGADDGEAVRTVRRSFLSPVQRADAMRTLRGRAGDGNGEESK